MAFIEGYTLGLAMIIFIGPVFFTLLKSTLQHGLKSGLSVALGVFSSDVVCVFLLYGLGVSAFFANPDYKYLIGIGGALLLLGMGVKYCFTRGTLSGSASDSVETNKNQPSRQPKLFSFFTQGFLINFLNPAVFGVWVAIIATATTKYSLESGRMVFLLGTLLGVITTDSLKAIFANRIKGLMKPQWLSLTYRGIGVALIAFGMHTFSKTVWPDFQPLTSAIDFFHL
ncbi:LysE family transporter [Pontibacter sp. G13]|uniref:LysE family translocator n=1 Tax=Pontibacter sp. G13 TaxID=3074898 RepID=UPI00288AB17A|nr:LysE family transporter [Pontibacter sp. G13]WNJ16336.1 LysE family transporter [Pontibacter sp. G13]